MQTFEAVVNEVYLPAYTALYAIKGADKIADVKQDLYSIAMRIKTNDNYIGNQDVIAKCNDILQTTNNKVKRDTLNELLFELLYSLRSELKNYCKEIAPLLGCNTLKLEQHYTWNTK